MIQSVLKRFLRGQTVTQWFLEFARFCTVGLTAYIVDIGLFNLVAYHWDIPLPFDRSMTAKTISITVSILVAWVGNRVWTFKEQARESTSRELAMFILVNLGGMAIALGCLATSRFILGYDSQVADNIAANGVGLVLGTAFRYVCYRFIVFSTPPAPTGGHNEGTLGKDNVRI